MSIHYTIIPLDLAGHLFRVTLQLTAPDPQGQQFQLPAWIPGSYMIREFARHIVRIKASSQGKKVALSKLDKHTWQAAKLTGVLTLEYDVYAWDLSVRAAHVDQLHGFFNGPSVFLCVLGQQHLQHTVDIMPPTDAGCSSWRVATALPAVKIRPSGFGTYAAENYDALIDHPVEMGNFVQISFMAHGVPHDFVLTGQVPNVDLARIAADLEKICTCQIALFEPKSKRAPMDRYVFLTMAVGNGYGGLEHRASTALLCNRADLPVIGQHERSEGYINFLGLCSHEYFHTWNIKRIKPEVFVHYDLQQENYTELLWLFEGVTSYYDELILLRSGLISEATYLKLLSKNFNASQRGAGQRMQSLAESSFDAWTKYYRQDENSPNAIVSYYTKGAMLALTLDLTIRRATGGKKSLDDLMRLLWQQFGRDFYALAKTGQQRGVDESQVRALLEQLTGTKMKSFFSQYVHGTKDLPLADLLPDFGLALVDQRNAHRPGLAAKLRSTGSECQLAQVLTDGAAHRAGLSAGDVLVAINGLRVLGADANNHLERLLAAYQIGDELTIHAFRRDELLTLTLKLQDDAQPQWALTPAPKSPKAKNIKLRPRRSY